MQTDEPLGQRDTIGRAEGDAGWRGVDERRYAPMLEPGWVSKAVNCRFRNGRIEPRGGDVICRWSPYGGQAYWHEVFTSGLFSNPSDGLEYWLVAGTNGGGTGVWAMRPNNEALAVPLPAGVTLTAATAVQFVQCFDVVILLRGADAAPLVCRNLDTGFEVITQTPSGTGTVAIPNATFGVFFANRLLLVHDRDQVAVSDVLDYTRYSPTMQEFRINQGDNDALVAIYPFDQTTLIMFKEQSVFRVDNVYGDLSAARLSVVTKQYGCIAPWSVVGFGTDVAWLSDRGIVTMKLTELNQIQATQQILSDPMSATMSRLNWRYASEVQGAYWNGYLYFAVPLDEALLLGPELVASGAVYDASGFYAIATTTGATYQWQDGAGVTDLVNGSDFVRGAGLVTAAGTSVTVRGAVGQPVNGSLKLVRFEGVNNALLVYDTLVQAWAGYDTRDGLCTRRLVPFTYQGVVRLGAVDRYGYARLLEEGFEDEELYTGTDLYVDVVVGVPNPLGTVATGQTIQVNGGTLVTASSASSVNFGGTWGTNTEDDAQDNLWADASGNPGYNQSLASPWTAPNTTPSQKDWGVRFLATNGSLPDVKINGTSVTASGTYGTGSWAYVDLVPLSRFVPVPIATEVVTRAYRLEDVDGKRFQAALCNLSTWNPTYTVSLLTEGVNTATALVSARTRSRTAYDYPKGKAAWDETNVNEDHDTRGRQDYSVVPDAVLGTALGDDGINFDTHQTATERLPLNDAGAWAQVKIENTTGRVEVNAVRLHGRKGVKTPATAAN